MLDLFDLWSHAEDRLFYLGGKGHVRPDGFALLKGPRQGSADAKDCVGANAGDAIESQDKRAANALYLDRLAKAVHR